MMCLHKALCGSPQTACWSRAFSLGEEDAVGVTGRGVRHANSLEPAVEPADKN